ncbi:hypothetical protein [Robbsia andropogonis]|nr:hypothetical protein [Robbsia andropogonis]
MQKQSVLPTLDPSTLPAGTRGFVCTDGRVLPLYKALPDDTKEGMYLALFDGRKDPNAVLLDEGFDGPVFGPLRYSQCLGNRLIVCFIDEELGAIFVPGMDTLPRADGSSKPSGIVEFVVDDGLIEFDGHYFAGHLVFEHEASEAHG